MKKQNNKFLVFLSFLLVVTFFPPSARAAANAQVVSVSPSSGTGLTQTFVFTYRDSAGTADLTDVGFLFSSTGDTVNNCWVEYDTVNKYFGLASDSTATWTYGTPGANANLQNSQCIINENGFQVGASGNNFILTVPVTFKAPSQTIKNIYLRSFDKEGGFTNFTMLGSWTVSDTLVLNQNLSLPGTMPTGMYFAPTNQWQELKNAGYDYVVTTVDAGNPSQWPGVFDAAQAAGIQLIVGASPGGSPAYQFANGTWTITANGLNMLNYFASRASLVKALFVYNEPYWENPFTGTEDSCGAISAADLRALRTTIQGVWPGAKIYHDLGAPSQWAPGGSLTSSYSCIGNKYADQTNVADYVGIWDYSVTSSGYDKTATLNYFTNEDNFVLNSMSPAVPINLAQGFGGETGWPQVMPTLSQLIDINCSFRSLPAAGISWYVWSLSPLYTDYLSNYPTYWTQIGNDTVCKPVVVIPPDDSSGGGSSGGSGSTSGSGPSGGGSSSTPVSTGGGGSGLSNIPVMPPIVNGGSSVGGGGGVVSGGSGGLSVPSTTPNSSAALKLVNNNGTYYLLQGGTLHGVTSPGILFSYGLDFSDAKAATVNDLAMPKSNLLLPSEGSLVKSEKDKTVYLVSAGQRYAFVSADVFTSLGFKFSSVLLVTDPELQALPKGADISNPLSAHPDGLDIDDRGTVYWVSGGIKHPYPSLDVYNSWHIDNDFSKVVPANAADRNSPSGDIVTARVLQ